MEFNNYIREKETYINNIGLLFNNKFHIYFDYTVPTSPEVYKSYGTHFHSFNLLSSYSDRIVSVNPIINIDFQLQEIDIFNDYKTNLIDINNFKNNGEVTITMVETPDHNITHIVKEIMSEFHGGLNLTRNLPEGDLKCIVTIYNTFPPNSELNKQLINIISIRYYGIIFTGLDNYNLEYGNKELHLVNIKQNYKYFEIDVGE